ncbi:MAG: hypothetical protein H0X50_04710 [Nitrosopumilus sp.]|nr:hypothetical protein [Nitrosopumilus sp.]
MLLVTLIIAILYYNSILVPKPQVISTGMDKFGVDEIYPTKDGGREWFLDMGNPKKDSRFSITNNIPIEKNDDGSWFINNSIIRMNVLSQQGDRQWKDIEMTGYVKVRPTITETTTPTKPTRSETNNLDTGGNNEDGKDIVDIDWRARGGRHNDNNPCEGTALSGVIYSDGTVQWKKEIWHTGGYTDAKGTVQGTSSINDRWIGWKVVMYNINDNQAVKMESYLDDENNNKWRKVTEIIDDGQWYANASDEIFYSAGCDRPKNHIITNSGPIATFRSDNVALNFKNLSIREIQPPT